MTAPAGPNLMDKLGFLVRFWELKARHAMLGAPLAPREQLELLSLMQLVTGDLQVPLAGSYTRPKSAVPAQIIGQGTIIAVEIRAVSAAALVAAAATTIPAGSRVILRAADAVTGIEFAIPCSVAWAYEGAPCTMALLIDGIPTRSEFAAVADLRARTAMSLGRHERLVS